MWSVRLARRRITKTIQTKNVVAAAENIKLSVLSYPAVGVAGVRCSSRRLMMIEDVLGPRSHLMSGASANSHVETVLQ